MAVLDIRKAGDKVLKEKAAPVERIDKKIRRLLDDMAETMYAAEGVGLAAPQVGVSMRIIVVDVGDGLIELINPVLSGPEGMVCASEGCLSIPGIYGDVERPGKIVAEGVNRHGRKVQIAADGMFARVLQHETDHLEGILFVERAKTIYKGHKDE